MENQSERDNYLISKTINPEDSQDYPFELITQIGLNKADLVSNQLRKKIGNKKINRREKTIEKEANIYRFDHTLSKNTAHFEMSKTMVGNIIPKQGNTRIRFDIRSRKSLDGNGRRGILNLQEQTKGFNKITIHCLRAKREQMQKSVQQMEREYKYAVRKLQKMQKQQQIQEQKAKLISFIKEESNKESQQYRQMKLQNQIEEIKKQQQLRQMVLSHRQHKEEVIQKSREQKLRQGYKQRLVSEQYFNQKLLASQLQYEQKKRMYSREKEEDVKRRHILNKIKDTKKIQAKIKFRSKWLNQFERSSEAKDLAERKKAQISIKLQRALQLYSSTISNAFI